MYITLRTDVLLF